MTQECGHKSKSDEVIKCLHPLTMPGRVAHCPGEASCLIHRQAVALEAIAGAMGEKPTESKVEIPADPFDILIPGLSGAKPLDMLCGACGTRVPPDMYPLHGCQLCGFLPKSGQDYNDSIFKTPERTEPKPPVPWVYIKPGCQMPDYLDTVTMSRNPDPRDPEPRLYHGGFGYHLQNYNIYAWTPYDPSITEPAPWPEPESEVEP